MIIFLNYSFNRDYLDYLHELLKNNFKKSYTEYIENYLSEFLNENLNIFIITKLNFFTEYLINKINNEFNYYILLFEKTKEIGIGSVNAFSNLYKTTLKKNIKFYYEIIEEDALFYNDIFYRKNKYLFKENFINYFYKELNIYNIRIFAMKENFEELILDTDFNKTLKNVSNELGNQRISH